MAIERVMLKFPLQMLPGKQVVMCPPGSVVRHLDFVQGKPTLWLECPLENGRATKKVMTHARGFEILATGQFFPDLTNYQGTCIDRDCGDGEGPLAWHVVEHI